MSDIIENIKQEPEHFDNFKHYQKELLSELNADPIFCHLDREIVVQLSNLLELENLSSQHPITFNEILSDIPSDNAITFFKTNHKEILPFLRRIELTSHMNNNYTVKYLRTLPELSDSGITHFQCASTLYRNDEQSQYYAPVATAVTNMLLRNVLEIFPPFSS